MPRARYRQNGLPLGDQTSSPELLGPEQLLPPGLQQMEQGQLDVLPLGTLFDGQYAHDSQGGEP
jgi:hypothetical protein